MKLTRYTSFKELKSDTKPVVSNGNIFYQRNMLEFKNFIDAARKKITTVKNSNKSMAVNE